MRKRIIHLTFPKTKIKIQQTKFEQFQQLAPLICPSQITLTNHSFHFQVKQNSTTKKQTKKTRNIHQSHTHTTKKKTILPTNLQTITQNIKHRQSLMPCVHSQSPQMSLKNAQTSIY